MIRTLNLSMSTVGTKKASTLSNTTYRMESERDGILLLSVIDVGPQLKRIGLSDLY